MPDGALREDAMFIKGDEFAEGFRCEPLGQNRVRRAVPLEDPVRHEPIRCALILYLLGRLSESQRLSLCEDIRQQHIVMLTKRVERLAERDEVARYDPGSLMDQLIEGVLAVGSRLTPIDSAGIARHLIAIQSDVLAIALHRQLLEICRESLQVLLVRQDSNCLCAKKVVVPNA